MKHINKVIFSILCLFFIVTNVKADLTCDVTINETGISNAGFKAIMPICKPKETGKYEEVTNPDPGTTGVEQRRTTQSNADGAGLDILEVFWNVATADDKDYISTNGYIHLCPSDKRKVKAYTSCDAFKPKETVKCTKAACKNGETSCTCTPKGKHKNSNGEEVDCNSCFTKGCKCDVTGTYEKCPDGYSKSGNYCKKTINFSTYVTKQATDWVITKQKECSKGEGVQCTCHAPSEYNKTAIVEYALECPTYTCEVEEKEVGACTPDFKVTAGGVSVDAYCVNPSLKLQKKTAAGTNYQTDTSFDVRKCANSYSTRECGFANILIEGTYHNIDAKYKNDAINLALRLWSYHANGVGFNQKTGLANRTGDSCNTSTYYMRLPGKDKKENVYVNTHKYIMETAKSQFYDIAISKSKTTGYIPDYLTNPETNTGAFNGSTFEKIVCQKSGLPIGVTCGDNVTYRIAFELFFNTLIGNKYMIEHLDSLYKETYSTDIKPIAADVIENQDNPSDGSWVRVKYEEEEFTKALGTAKRIKCDSSDPTYKANEAKIKPYCTKDITIVWVDTNGNQTTTNVKPDFCDKNIGCVKVYKENLGEAICTEFKDGKKITEIWVKYTKPTSSLSVKKYVACGETKGTQELYSFIPENVAGKFTSKVEEYEKFRINYVCQDTCKDYDVRTSGENLVDGNKCKKGTGKETYSKTYKDPSLSCIVHMESSLEKESYDYSSYFGVNTNLCRIYCSDQVDYVLAGETDSYSGQAFVYDVQTKSSGFAQNYKLSSVIKMTRRCTSEIYYDRLPYNVDWLKMYGIDKDDKDDTLQDLIKDLEDNNNFESLFKLVSYNDTRSKNNVRRTENLNQLAYDLYNCNLYNKNVFNDRDLTVPHNNKVVNVLEKVQKTYQKANNYGYQAGSNYESKFIDIVDYNGGAKIVEYDGTYETNTIGTVGKDPNNINTKRVFENVTVSGVKYCNRVDCLKYDDKSEKYTYTGFGSSEERSGKINGYILPTNSYAYFEINGEMGFYNVEKYKILPGTGNVLHNDTTYKELYELPDYNYPLDKYAYHNCTTTSSGVYCDVKQNISISLFHRAKDIDRLQTATNKNTFTCSVKVKLPGVEGCPESNSEDITKCTNYRNVDPANLFPSKNVADNWAKNGDWDPVAEVEATASSLKTDEKYHEYSITLTPQQIKALKEYNKNHNAYIEETVYKCEMKNVNGNDIYLNCRNGFLDLLRGKSTEFSAEGTLGTITSKYN